MQASFGLMQASFAVQIKLELICDLKLFMRGKDKAQEDGAQIFKSG